MKLAVTLGRSVVNIRRPREPDPDRPSSKPGLRDRVWSFSDKSRLNLSVAMGRVLSGEPCHHLTVTYGRDIPPRERWDLARRAMIDWLTRRGYWGFWRLEYQRRGAPHWHFLVWGPEPLDAEEAWARISGNLSDFACHVSGGDLARAAWYLAMHAAKRGVQDQHPEGVSGRFWGFVRRSRVIAHSPLNEVELDGRAAVWFERFLRRRFSKMRAKNQRKKAVWFANYAEISRLIDLAKELGKPVDNSDWPF